jgi:hypothetical protein
MLLSLGASVCEFNTGVQSERASAPMAAILAMVFCFPFLMNFDNSGFVVSALIVSACLLATLSQ